MTGPTSSSGAKSALDGHIDSYGEAFRFAFDNELILDWYPRRITQRVTARRSLLELGVGHGLSTAHFSRHFERHVVVEGSGAVIRQFHKNNPDCLATLVESLFEDFDTPECFDCVVMGFVLEHVASPPEILRRFKKFLAPGGRCFIAVPNAQSLHRRIGKEAGFLDDVMALGSGDLALGHRRLYSVDTLTREAESCGYRVVNMEGIFLKPFSTAQLQTLRLPPSVLRALCALGVGYPELSCALLAEVAVSSP